MKKKGDKESDEVRLKKKLHAPPSASEGTGRTPASRRLRKHLKRVQRKRRRLALRKHHAAGKKGTEGAQKTGAAAP
ncbi:MAG: hypothetical protein E8D45_11100 [Nitrospira sp.]|nr:MAG: hypothetical protein E8D45_11100 [Nitrospira sp.]